VGGGGWNLAFWPPPPESVSALKKSTLHPGPKLSFCMWVLFVYFIRRCLPRGPKLGISTRHTYSKLKKLNILCEDRTKHFMVAIWPFLKRFASIYLFGYLAFFWILKKMVYFKACFGEIWAKLAIFYKILTLSLVILTKFWRKFVLFETAYGQI